MRDYRLYFLDSDGHIRMAQTIRCVDDLDALAESERLAGSEGIEIWEESRMVARVKPNDVRHSPEDTSYL